MLEPTGCADAENHLGIVPGVGPFFSRVSIKRSPVGEYRSLRSVLEDLVFFLMDPPGILAKNQYPEITPPNLFIISHCRFRCFVGFPFSL